METIREKLCRQEHIILSEYAAFSDRSRGRVRADDDCTLRTAFQRDRDRILHTNSFRRLKHKTQVFLSPEGDHYRTRLTHTLEVSQIARTISRCLGLNEDLTEAIALGHDLGHTPFGHAGERALDSICESGFKHYSQSLRVADVLENGGRGLNLTYEVRNGIERHTSGENAETLEGQVVRLSDRIAYINHDIEDAQNAGILKNSDIPQDIRSILGNRKSERIDTLVKSCVHSGLPNIKLEKNVEIAFLALHEFMFENVYTNPVCKGEESKAIEMIIWLFRYFEKNYDHMPVQYQKIIKTESLERAVCDYISGMTDRYAIKVFNDLFVPKAWMY